MLFERGRYTGFQINATTFNVSLVDGYRAIPENIETQLYARDAAGNEASFSGKRVGTQIVSSYTFDTTASNDVMPVFNGDADIITSLSAKYLSRATKRGGIVHMGQSNGVGWAEVNFDPLLEPVDPRIRQYIHDLVYQYYDTPNGVDRMQIAETPLAHPNTNTHTGLLHQKSAGSTTHFATALLDQAGWGGIDILPCSRNGTDSVDWAVGGYLRERMIQMMINWLGFADNHELAVIVFHMGESDGLIGTSQAAFDAFMEEIRLDVITRVNAGASVDISNVPWVAVGMVEAWYPTEQDYIDIQNSLISWPTRAPRSSFVTCDGLAVDPTDVFQIHLSNEGQRILGRDRLIEGYFAAQGNETGIADVPPIYDANINSSFEDMVAAVSASHVVTGPAPATANISSSFEDMTAAVSASIGSAPVANSRPLTAAIAGSQGFYANEGVTTWGAGQTGNLNTWADAFGGDAITGGANTNGVTDGGVNGLDFSTVAIAPKLSTSPFNGPVFSLVLRFRGTEGTPVLKGSSGNDIIFLGASGFPDTYVNFLGTSPKPALAGSTDGNWHDLSFVKQANGDTVVILDGVTIYDGAGTVVTSANALDLGKSTYNFDFDGDISMLYVNKVTALTPAQVATVLSERVVA